MQNVCRPPQPGDLGPSLCSAGLPVGPALAQRRMEATRGLCLELITRARRENWVSWAAACADAALRMHEHAHELCMESDALNADLLQQAGRCDLIFRTSSGNSAYSGLHMRGKAASPPRRTSFFDEACACLVPPPSAGLLPDIEANIDVVLFHQQFQAFTEAACGKHVPKDAYGVAGNVLPLVEKAAMTNRNVFRVTHELIEEMLRECPASVSPRSPMQSYQQVYDAIETYIATKHPSPLDGPAFLQRIEGRALEVKELRSTVSLIFARVGAHVQRRREAGLRLLEGADDDAVAYMARYLSPAAAAALMQTCTQFDKSAVLRACMPHLHIRNAVGAFPHHRVTSFDRMDLAVGRKRARMRDFVCANKAVHLYVDFVAPELRAAPLKKKPRADGLDNRDHDFSDDEFEDPPEHHRGPQPESNPYTMGTLAWTKHDHREKLKRSAWENAEGPSEPIDRYVYMKRMQYDTYFAGPLEMTAALVYADDHTPVPCIRAKSALDVSSQLMRDHGVFKQPSRFVRHMAPAHAKFHVRHLTLDHNGRLFKLRIEATGRLKAERGGQAVKWTLHTQPFEAVSKETVVKQACKRRTERERQARIRATKESSKRAIA